MMGNNNFFYHFLPNKTTKMQMATKCEWILEKRNIIKEKKTINEQELRG